MCAINPLPAVRHAPPAPHARRAAPRAKAQVQALRDPRVHIPNQQETREFSMSFTTRSPAHNRRALLTTAALAAGALGLSAAGVQAAPIIVKIGISLPLTGADAESATLIKDGALLAIDQANAKNMVPGYTFVPMVLNNATATAGQYDPAQAATNAKKFLSDPKVIAIVGPEMSGDGKAMSPILSQGDMACVTPASTNPDITSPAFAGQYRPRGKAVYFRTVTTDAYQGPNMANFYKDDLHVKSVYILDDSGAYGVGLANAFEAQAKKIGIKVLGHDQLDPKDADYTTILTKIKGLGPDAIYYGGVGMAGVKLIKQAYDIVPKMIKGGGDGMYGTDLLTGAGFPAAQGWYATIAAPHLLDDSKASSWVKAYDKKFGKQPSDYAITSYDAAEVILHAVKAVAMEGKKVSHSTVRDAIQKTDLMTLQGKVSFNENGDLMNKVISVFEIEHNPKYPLDDMIHQYKYIGVAPQNAS